MQTRASTPSSGAAATATTAPRSSQGLSRSNQRAGGPPAGRASSRATPSAKKNSTAAGSATDFSDAAIDKANPAAAETPITAAGRRTRRAPNRPANASASQKMKWISERKSAPYSMNGK